MRTIGVDERRARLGRRHLLAPGLAVDDPVAIARSVVVLHASDPSTVVLSVLARMAHPDPAVVEAALYEERRLVRMLGMRRTLWTVPVELAPVVQASSARAVAANERRRLEQLLEAAGVAKRVGPWLRKVEAATLAAVEERGEVAGAELTKAVPGLDTKLHLAEGKAYAATVSVSSRVLLLLAADGHLVRGRPRGGWTSGQHRWSTTAHWLGAPLDDLDPADAKAELARQWLARFGPGTVADVAWWTGWTLGATRAALAHLDTEEVQLDDGSIGLVLADDVDEVTAPDPWVALLPGLDPTPMGWKERGWYLGPHKAEVFDRNGNVGPTVWADGRIVGGWAQRKDGEIVTRLLEDLGRERAAAVGEAADRLQAAIGDVRFTPRFPAPLDKALVGAGGRR
jgi:hypothetical protein